MYFKIYLGVLRYRCIMEIFLRKVVNLVFLDISFGLKIFKSVEENFLFSIDIE